MPFSVTATGLSLSLAASFLTRSTNSFFSVSFATPSGVVSSVVSFSVLATSFSAGVAGVADDFSLSPDSFLAASACSFFSSSFAPSGVVSLVASFSVFAAAFAGGTAGLSAGLSLSPGSFLTGSIGFRINSGTL